MSLSKKQELWSLKDYYDVYQSHLMTISDIWERIIHGLEFNAYNTFISMNKNFSKTKDFSSQLFNKIPIAIKDNICTTDFPTTCASKMLSGWYPPYNAHIIDQLLNNDFLIIGKTNLDEFAMGNTTGTSFFGHSTNPWDKSGNFTPGGSSGGSAIAVASGLVPVAIGSDTGGSIRCPAAWCGVLGLKPTYGRVSRYGLISYAHTLDAIGCFSRYAEDASKVLEILSKPDKNDMTYQNKPYKHGDLSLAKPISIGVPTNLIETLPSNIIDVFKKSINVLEKIPNVTIEEFILEDISVLLPTYYVIAMSEAYSNLARYTGQQYGFKDVSILQTRLKGFGEEVSRRMKLGAYTLEVGYEEQLYSKAQQIREYYRKKFHSYFQKMSIFALPTMTDVAMTWEELKSPMDSYLADLFTVPANLIGIPALSMPIGFVNKINVRLPVGLQLLTDWWSEDKILHVAWEYQQRTAWHTELPPKLQNNRERIKH